MKYPRNNPCPCGALVTIQNNDEVIAVPKKFKNCCMYINKGLTNTSEGWIDQKEVNKRKLQAIGAL